MTSLPRSDSARVGLVAILVGAAALRVTGSGYGLPYPLLDPDEENIVARSWRMAHERVLDPGWFDYPSLFLYLNAPLQALTGEPSYRLARFLAVAVGVAGVATTWWLGRRSYGTRAALVGALAVAVATTHVAYSRVAVTDVLLTTLLTVALALALADRLEWAGLAVGLAASAKYPGAIGLVPLVVAGWRTWRRLVPAVALAAAAFLATSPFVALRASEAWEDISRVQRLARDGWLGFEADPIAPLAFADHLWGALGPFLVVASIGVAVALRRRERADLVLASFVVAYSTWLCTLAAHFDRYALPLLPVLAVLAARIRTLVPVALLTLLVPLAWSVGDTTRLLGTDARVSATRWAESELPAGRSIAVDPSALGHVPDGALQLALPGPGVAFDERRNIAWLRAHGVSYVVVSGHVADRVRAAATRYPREIAFYDALERSAVPVYRAEPGDDVTGPWVEVYRL